LEKEAKKMDIRANFRKAVVLLVVVVMMSSTVALANTDEKHLTISTNDAGTASASSLNALVWDNGIGYQVGVLAAQYYPGDLDAFPADDFMVDATYEVDTVFWQGGYYNCQYAAGGQDYNFPWNITFYNHNATGNKPGTVYQEYSFDNASITREFWYTTDITSRWYANFTVTLSPPMTILPNTKYWISIYAYNATFPQAGWSRHNETIGGIKLDQGKFRSDYFGYPDWINASDLLAGVKQDFNYQLGGELVAAPVLEIETIKGPIGVTATIKNTGDAKATDVNWEIAFTSGMIFVGKAKNGTISEIAADGSANAKIPLVLGFGKAVIGVNVACAEGSTASKEQNATVLLILVLVK
jgi:hypothetical protein